MKNKKNLYAIVAIFCISPLPFLGVLSIIKNNFFYISVGTILFLLGCICIKKFRTENKL